VYIPDVCIAEAFKVLAKKYYREKVFSDAVAYNLARKRFSHEITVPVKTLKAYNRQINFHDISTSRDVIISVDRFLEVFMKKKLDVSVPDLIILATAKYLIDFFRIPRTRRFIVTMDENLHKGSRKLPDIPSAFNPTRSNERVEKVFV
jgi:predicted nucleic acid-binding protein